MITDSNKHQRAVDYVKNAVDRWRLETLQYRCRYSLKTGKLKKLPTQLRRFINSVPVDIVNDVLETLAASCPYKGTVFNLEDDEGLVYRPTRTMIRKDASLQSNTKDATYTIIQDLQLIDGTTDVFGYQDSSSCSQMSTAEYHWDESDVVDCPDGSQGVVYQIADISRDPNTDLFTYRIRKIQALTQHMGPYVARCNIDSVVTVETWDNVYGSEGAYTWDPVADHGNGAKIVLPVPCDHAEGTSYEISVTENPDCTFKIAVQKTVAKNVPGMEYMRYRDQYQIKTSDTDKNASAPLSKNGVEYSNGAMTEYQSRHNPDGSWDNVVAVNTERPVAKSTVEYTVGTRFTVSRWTDTNQGAAAAGLPAGAKFGSYKFTKTPGGLFTNEYASYTKADKQNLGLECLDTAFLHTHVAQATADFSSDYHVPAAKDGIVRRRTYNVDDYGICTQADETRTEHTVDSSQVSYTVTPLGVIAETRDRSESPEKTKAMEALIAAYSPANIGRSLSYSLTDGKLYDLSYRKITLNPDAFTQSQCSQTVFEHVDSETRAGGKLGNHVDTAGGGVFRRSETRLDDATGAVLTTSQKTVELPVSMAQRSVEVTNRATRVTVLDRNQKTTTSITTATKPGQVDARTENDGASVNVQTTSVTPNAGALVNRGCTKTSMHHQHFAETVAESAASVDEHVEAAHDGIVKRTDVSVDDQGVPVRRDSVDEEITEEYKSRRAKNIFEEVVVNTTFSNATNISDPVPVFTQGQVTTVESQLTDGKHYNTVQSTVKASPQHWIDDIAAGGSRQITYTFRNFKESEVETAKLWILTQADAIAAADTSSNLTIRPSIRRTLNDYQLYDGVVELSIIDKDKAYRGSGSGKKIKEVPAQILYEYKTLSVKYTSDPETAWDEAPQRVKETCVIVTHARGYGVGLNSWKTYLDSLGKIVLEGSQMGYDRTTQQFEFDVITDIKVAEDIITPNKLLRTTFYDATTTAKVANGQAK